jgi:hypothetical protein
MGRCFDGRWWSKFGVGAGRSRDLAQRMQAAGLALPGLLEQPPYALGN